MPIRILPERHIKMILVTLKIICKKSANMDLRGEEKENFCKSKRHNKIAEKDLLFKWRSSL